MPKAVKFGFKDLISLTVLWGASYAWKKPKKKTVLKAIQKGSCYDLRYYHLSSLEHVRTEPQQRRNKRILLYRRYRMGGVETSVLFLR